MRLKNISSLSGALGNYEMALLLEIVRSECAEVPGFPYLTKKCYLVEQKCGTRLFEFKQDDSTGASSDVMRHLEKAMRQFEIIRIEKLDEAEATKNYCGEECRENLALTNEQIVGQYLDNLRDDSQLKKWYQTIDTINRHPCGKDWHTLSVAVHLHNQQLDWLRSMSEMRRQARDNKVSLPEGVFRAATGLLYDLDLHPE